MFVRLRIMNYGRYPMGCEASMACTVEGLESSFFVGTFALHGRCPVLSSFLH